MSKPLMCEMLEYGYVTKDKKNTAVGVGYSYASDETVSKRIRDGMRSHGLYVESCEIVSLSTSRVSLGDAMVTQAVIHVRFMFSDGETAYGPYDGAGMAMDKGDKAVFKALTGARKYAIAQSVLLSWGDDPEGDASIDKLAEAASSPAPAKPLSDASAKVLKAAEKVSSQGLEAVKSVWQMASKEVQIELKEHPEWTLVKVKAENAEKPD